MKASTRSLALRAAAKAALSLSLAGCGGTLTHGQDPEMGSSDMDSGPANHAVVAIGMPCTGLDGSADASVSAATLACCNAFLAPSADAAFGALAVDAGEPGVIGCCSAIVAYVDHSRSVDAWASEEAVLPGCCQHVDPRPIGPACTPWGPPVPPAMPENRTVHA